MNGQKFFLFIGVILLSICRLVFAAGDFPNPNLNNDETADFYDFAILANNWQQTGTSLAGDFDDSNTVDIDDLTMFCWFWLAEYSEYQQCQGMRIDLDSDGIIAFEDLAELAQNWLLSGTGLTGDFDDSNSVDCNDLSIFADCWLCGSRPESIWEQFKAALAAGDVNTALTFIAETSRDKYTEVFQIIGGRLPDYAAGMGDLILISNSETDGIAKYEMRHQAGSETYLFPVIFRKNEQEIWQIYGF
ncbi:MAG: hypothetical protein JW749_00060 [Sedimentisphaerales bacterium]|nr:hypothetical protein [Sedimentisphaerales bacterium]